MFIIAYGDPIDGMSFVGPFEDDDGLDEYARDNLQDSNWWIVKLEKPEAYWTEGRG